MKRYHCGTIQMPSKRKKPKPRRTWKSRKKLLIGTGGAALLGSAVIGAAWRHLQKPELPEPTHSAPVAPPAGQHQEATSRPRKLPLPEPGDHIVALMPTVMVCAREATKNWRVLGVICFLLCTRFRTARNLAWLVLKLLVVHLCTFGWNTSKRYWLRLCQSSVNLMARLTDGAADLLLGEQHHQYSAEYIRELQSVTRRLAYLRRRWWRMSEDDVAFRQEVLDLGDEVFLRLLESIDLENLADNRNRPATRLHDDIMSGPGDENFDNAFRSYATTGLVPGYVDSRLTAQLAALHCKVWITISTRFSTRVAGKYKQCDDLYTAAFGTRPLEDVTAKEVPRLKKVASDLEQLFRNIGLPVLESPAPTTSNMIQSTFTGQAAVNVALDRVASSQIKALKKQREMISARYEQDRRFSPSPMNLATGAARRRRGKTKEDLFRELAFGQAALPSYGQAALPSGTLPRLLL